MSEEDFPFDGKALHLVMYGMRALNQHFTDGKSSGTTAPDSVKQANQLLGESGDSPGGTSVVQEAQRACLPSCLAS